MSGPLHKKIFTLIGEIEGSAGADGFNEGYAKAREDAAKIAKEFDPNCAHPPGQDCYCEFVGPKIADAIQRGWA